MGSIKNRRSERVDTRQRMMLEIVHPVALKEIIITEEVSWHGAKVLARRKIPKESRGLLHMVPSGRQVPCRVVWQKSELDGDGRMSTGIEIYPTTNFWGLSFQGAEFPDPLSVPAAVPGGPAGGEPARDAAAILASMTGERADPSSSLLVLWSGLVQALQDRGIFTRQDLITTLQKMAK